MVAPSHIRSTRAVRVHCPIDPSTARSLLAGDLGAMDADGLLAPCLAIIRGDNPLGDFGVYTGVIEISFGLESFRPSAAAVPTLGRAGELALCPTVVLTTFVRDDAPEEFVAKALDALMAAHPWETPVIEIFSSGLLVRGSKQ